MSRILARLPFTLLLEATILIVALWLGLFEPEVGARWRERQGFGWTSLVEGRPWTLLTSTVLVDGFSQWLRIALLLTWSLGVLEWRAGTRRAALVYCVTNFASCLATAAIQAACAELSDPHLAFARSLDVGASAGAFGCMGAAILTLQRPWRERIGAVALLYMVVKPLCLPVPVSDVLHTIAFALGAALGATTWLGLRGRAEP